DVEHQRRAHPCLRELEVVVLADRDEDDPEDRDRVDQLLGDRGDLVVGLRDRQASGPAVGLRLRRVQPVEEHRAEPDDGRQDVQQEHEVERSALTRHRDPLAFRGASACHERVGARRTHGQVRPNCVESTIRPVNCVPICSARNTTAGTTASGALQPDQSKSSPSWSVASSVFTAPGRSAFTVTPRSATSGASAVVKRSMAAFATTYVTNPGGIAAVAAWSAPPDETLMMLPPPFAAMCGTTSFASRNRLRTLVLIESSHISTVVSSNAPRVGAIALFTSTSTRPYSRIAASTNPSRSRSTPTSHRTGSARPPDAVIAAAVAATLPGSPSGCSSNVRAAHTTDAPRSASPTASALPIPRDAPVTIATLPSSSIERSSRISGL